MNDISKSFCVYLLTCLNLIHAIQTGSYDWILWASLGLSGLSLVLSALAAIKGVPTDA
jgi:hypothetical protein